MLRKPRALRKPAVTPFHTFPAGGAYGSAVATAGRHASTSRASRREERRGVMGIYRRGRARRLARAQQATANWNARGVAVSDTRVTTVIWLTLPGVGVAVMLPFGPPLSVARVAHVLTSWARVTV